MRILLCGAFAASCNVYTYASSFVTALQQLGHTVTTLNTKMPHYHRLLRPLMRHINDYRLNATLRCMVNKQQPEMIFIIKGNRIFARTIAQIKATHTTLIVHFHPDNPFVLWNGNSSTHVLQSLPSIDCWLSWSHMLIPALYSAGCQHVTYFPFAFDETLFNKSITITDDEQRRYEADVSFIGTWEPMREQWLTYIRIYAPTITIKIWGNGWLEHIATTSPLYACLQGPALYATPMIKAMRCARINLNFIRQQNRDAHNMRTFEIPASNAFMLTERTHEQITTPFEENKNIACFSSQEELLKKIELYLHDAHLRESITKNSWLAVQDYTLRKQLQKTFELVKERYGACFHTKSPK